LICTTGEDVIGNLSGSIKSNIASGGKSHACILATSQRLTNFKKRALEERAKEFGRSLIQIYDQAAITQLLYRDARWLKELLGLTGDPPPLSLFPITTRPLIDVPPLGRDSDIAKRAFYFGLRFDRLLPSAVAVLTKEQRQKLIDELPQTSAVAELVRALVSRDMDLFLHLLSRTELKSIRLDPLRIDDGNRPNAQPVIQEFDDGWQKMAIVAMEHGLKEIEVFSATQGGGGYSWSGPMSSMYTAKLTPFKKLLQHPDVRLRNIGKIGFESFSKIRDEFLVAEKHAAVRGGTT